LQPAWVGRADLPRNHWLTLQFVNRTFLPSFKFSTAYHRLQPESCKYSGRHMTDSILEDIHAAMRKGAKLAIGRSYYGGYRLKLTYGPFGLFKRRLNVKADDMQRLYQSIKMRSVAA
jgi:hypothetical protein